MRMKLLLLLSLVGTALAFRPSASAIRGRPLVQKGSTPRVVLIAKPRQALLQYSLELTALWSSPNGSDEGDKIVILTGSEDGEFPEEMMQSIEDGKPSEWMVMKQLMGINIFTYILAALIVAGLSLNFFLGPGWLGNAIGIQGTGTFNEVSDSLPDTIDLSDPAFRL